MYEVFWYHSSMGVYATVQEASIELYRGFQCAGIALDREAIALWQDEGNGIQAKGRWLNTLDMLFCGRRLDELWNTYEYHNSDTFRQGPVRGIRKWRGGGGYFRRIHTMPERRQNLAVLDDEGPGMVRSVRCHLPNSWDDIGRTLQRNWKEQHRGHKAWDKER